MKIRITAAWFAMAMFAGVEAGEIELIIDQEKRS
jgi:hypothetical protein